MHWSSLVWFGHIYWEYYSETLKNHINALLVFLVDLLVLVVGPGPGVLPHVSVLYVEPSVLENVSDF